MKRILSLSLLLLFIHATAQNNSNLYVVSEFSVGQKVGLLRAVPVSLGEGKKGLLLAYSADKDIDPSLLRKVSWRGLCGFISE